MCASSKDSNNRDTWGVEIGIVCERERERGSIGDWFFHVH